ncbi:MAG: PIN domain-containing protein [Hydrogenophaga sp.]|nr:PIN domain-containing protein [Hydrogenophaga sp.]
MAVKHPVAQWLHWHNHENRSGHQCAGRSHSVAKRLQLRIAVVAARSAFSDSAERALYTEWQDVLSRPEHLPPGMQPEDARGFLRYLASIAHLQDVYYLWRPFLRDPDDDMVLECAVASGSRYVITHNLRDFRKITQLNIEPLTPAEFLARLRSTP